MNHYPLRQKGSDVGYFSVDSTVVYAFNVDSTDLFLYNFHSEQISAVLVFHILHDELEQT